MNRRTGSRRFCIALAWMAFAYGSLLPLMAWGEGPPRVTPETTSPQKLSLTVGKSLLLENPEPVKRVSLAAPEIVDAMVLTPQQIYLTGKAPGITDLTLWGAGDKVSRILALEVLPDTSRIKEMLHQILPEEKDIRVNAIHDNLTLSGTVSSTANLSQVLALTEPFFPKKVINLLEVAGVHQVMLEVRVAEMSRTLLKRLGVNFNYLSSSGINLGSTLLNNLTRLPEGLSSPNFLSKIPPVNREGFAVKPLSISDQINAVFRFMGHKATWTIFIDALKEEGLLKVLAEPTLITLSGKSANFLAGGEFPVPIPQVSAVAGATITIEYKPFGVGLNFTPTVLSNQKISMEVVPEVSELDFANAIAISGFLIPALTTRRVSTVIELADGQSFAIAGLLQDTVRANLQKYPLLGDIPILGALFRSTSYQKSETELIVIVTPHLVKPLDMAKQTLPTDSYVEPNDFELYLLGALEGKEKKKSSNPTSSLTNPQREWKLEGKFGHIIPK